jgi:hypothetical protein
LFGGLIFRRDDDDDNDDESFWSSGEIRIPFLLLLKKWIFWRVDDASFWKDGESFLRDEESSRIPFLLLLI